MAQLDPTQVKPAWSDTGARTFMLFAVLNVSAGDTADLSPYFRVLKQTFWMGATTTGQGAGTSTGTTVTAPAGLNSDACYLLVGGVPL